MECLIFGLGGAKVALEFIRHKFDSMRRLPSSRASGPGLVRVRSQRVATSPSAEPMVGDLRLGKAKPIVDGEGILDVVKNITKRTGRKAVNKLAKKVGRKIGKEVVSSIGKKNENAGDRIREILEANSITRMGHPSDPRSVQTKPVQWLGRAPGESLSNQAPGLDWQRRRAETRKVNEAVSRLLADDD